MNKEFVPPLEALALKELGFDEPCLFAYYGKSDISNFRESDYVLCGDRHNSSLQRDGRISTPLFQQAFRWFREKYDLQYNITWNKFYDKTPYQYEVRPTWRNEPLRPYGIAGMCSTYEEAEIQCLERLISIVNEKQAAKKAKESI